jgi:hypothetical protein
MGYECERVENSHCSCLELNDGSLPTHQYTKLYPRLEKKISRVFPALLSLIVFAQCFGHFTAQNEVRVKYGPDKSF